jgi:hypothetical protein
MNPAARNATGPLSPQLRSRASLDLAIAWLSVSCLFLLALLLYLPALGSPSLWFDEAFSVDLARQHPRLFYIVGRVPDSQAAQQVSAVETWLDQHYQLLASMSSAGGISVRLYAIVPSTALLRPGQGPSWS